MNKKIFTSKGTPLLLGREIGKGGEGSVYEIPTLNRQVAKIYHTAPDGNKQAKLSFMASVVNPQLLSYVTWPQETLHSSCGGPVVGFLMPEITGNDPIHMIYSPAHRRQDYPNAAWDFLVYVARNIAASFETVHEHGHVIGDVNQNSFLVGRDSKVVLIDSDSFQVNANGNLHLCEVGVSHFTPPELQSLSSFQGFVRTKNHDNFGLALLIFHVLFGGRHPFSGVPLRSDVGDALEIDIKNFRYTYARDNHLRGVTSPPRSIHPAILPNPMEAMFCQAFTELGVSAGRPTANQWVSALDNLRNSLKKCGVSRMHVFPNHLANCPWCELEQQGVAYFIDLGVTVTTTTKGFVLEKVWGIIQSIPSPSAISMPQPGGYSFSAQPLPDNVISESTTIFYKAIVVTIVIAILIKAPHFWFFDFILGAFGWAIACGAGAQERNEEFAKRRRAYEIAKQEYDQLVERAKKETGPEGFHAIKAELNNLRNELESLPKEEKMEMDRLHSSAYDRQKERFLDTCFIDTANISGVGPARKAALRSFGIETAADVSKTKVMQVRGFGESLTRAVIDWKASCERRFKFNPATAVTQADLNVLKAKFVAKRAILEKRLVAAPIELQKFQQTASSRLISLMPQLEESAKKLSKAQADLSVIY